ncbi:MAG: glycerol-3-phosphate 1-O-acyltransferase PlsY [Lachnospiraceae bacterium]|nr:glycerol-3-phosphate 1-O-acyltransferase PlsY [Lachnospiraceae bacterium]
MNRTVLMIILCALMGYLVGCINLSYILSKIKGYDIREHGSGNAGASNVVILMGKRLGLIVAIVDILKAFAAIKIAGLLLPGNLIAFFVTAVCVVLGHIFPFYIGFKGGKGLATLGGSILAYDYRMFLIMLLIVFVMVMLTDYICTAPLFASVVFPLYTVYDSKTLYPLIFLVATLAIYYRHLENLMRIREGKELKFSYLWNSKKEAKRFGIDDYDGKHYPFGRGLGAEEKEKHGQEQNTDQVKEAETDWQSDHNEQTD